MEKLQCSICGGPLTMSADGEKAICEYCGMSFRKETVKKMILELAGPVRVEGVQNSDSLSDRAETFLKLGETEKAKECFYKMTNEYPSDYRGWWGLTRLTDWNEYFYNSGTDRAEMPVVCERAIEFAPTDVKEKIRDYFDERVQLVKDKTDRELIYQKVLKEATDRAKEAERNVSCLNSEIAWLPKKIKEARKLTYNKYRDSRDKDYRPITLKNLIALVFGCMVTYVVWDEFHPIGTPILTVIALGLPILFIVRRLLGVKRRWAQAADMKRQLIQAKAELPKAEEELIQAQAALEAVRNEKPD